VALWCKGHESVITLYSKPTGSVSTLLTWAGEHQASKNSGKIPESQKFKKIQPIRVIMMTQRGNQTILRIQNSMEKIK
jgi:hypothetical protein